eukprot:TRINITY_DN12885_c0_g1_i13.p1 TRINITY_DN12885_c0_g1~~TRINITY_DN12885_c0_g1_i13.p1  ORF type:complete len:413 (+),score=134.98 TRINITY_DN12885_c0_g1_i13:1472-2710(+)
MGNEFLFDDENHYRDSEVNSGVKFVSLGPGVFQNLRSLHCVDENDLTNLFSVSNLLKEKLKVKLQSGKGGAFFVFPEEGAYLIKSINGQEYEVMKEILPELYIHFLKYPSSFINPIYGCYALYLSESGEIEPQYFVLMKNVLPLNKALLPPKSETLCFDIKGSSAGRKTLEDPNELLGSISEKAQRQTLKDADFLLSFGKLDLISTQAKAIREQLERDANFFSKFMLIDYSLLLYIINIPYRSYVSSRSGITYKKKYEKGMHTQELILAEKSAADGKAEIIVEEKERGTNTVYRITNSNDIETMRKIDDMFAESKEADTSNVEDSFERALLKSNPAKYNSDRRTVINFPKIISTNNIARYTTSNKLHIEEEKSSIDEENQIIKRDSSPLRHSILKKDCPSIEPEENKVSPTT